MLAVSADPWQLSVVDSEYSPVVAAGSPQHMRAHFESHANETESQIGDTHRQATLISTTKSDFEPKEPPSLELFIRRLIDSALMNENECRSYLESLPESACPHTSEQLAELMCNRGILTRFQVDMLCQGKIRDMVIGNYALLDRLGHGGMGHVYKARHLRMDRVVSLKILPRNATKSPWAVKCFQREARAAAKLAHPNIVMAHDADEANGMHFLVMEYIDGQDLWSAIRQNGPLTVADAVNYLIQAAHGLEYAHTKGIIHRDIKPSNLLLDKQGNIKILDMGLAHINEGVASSEFETDESSDNNGHIMGTLEYMSPEQALDPNLASIQSDIYCLGCTLYFLLLGRPPFGGDTMAKKILAHRDQPIPSLRATRSDVPGALDVVFRRMIAKNPLDRHRSMAELIDELREVNVPRNDEHVRLMIQPQRVDKKRANRIKKPPASTGQTADAKAMEPPFSKKRLWINLLVFLILGFLTLVFAVIWFSFFYRWY
jgi:eukaryotic-like serine/threonine-protein kinase